MRESLPPDHREDEPENGQRIAPLAGVALSITDTGLSLVMRASTAKGTAVLMIGLLRSAKFKRDRDIPYRKPALDNG